MKSLFLVVSLFSSLAVFAQATGSGTGPGNNTTASLAGDYTGMGASIVNAVVKGVEQEQKVVCEYDHRDHLTLVFSLTKNITCRDSSGVGQIIIKVKGNENPIKGTQTFKSVTVKYLKNSACNDCKAQEFRL